MGEKSGLIISLVVGIAALVIGVIIAFVVIDAVADVHADIDVTTESASVTGETTGVFINNSGYTLALAGVTGFASPVITDASNSSGDNIAVGNITVSDAGVVTNATTLVWSSGVILNYTYTFADGSVTVENLRTNFTGGIDNVAEKLPTILLIAAVVLVLGILVMLWQQYQRMGMSSGGSL